MKATMAEAKEQAIAAWDTAGFNPLLPEDGSQYVSVLPKIDGQLQGRESLFDPVWFYPRVFNIEDSTPGRTAEDVALSWFNSHTGVVMDRQTLDGARLIDALYETVVFAKVNRLAGTIIRAARLEFDDALDMGSIQFGFWYDGKPFSSMEEIVEKHTKDAFYEYENGQIVRRRKPLAFDDNGLVANATYNVVSALGGTYAVISGQNRVHISNIGGKYQISEEQTERVDGSVVVVDIPFGTGFHKSAVA